VATIEYICTKFGVDSSSRFLFRVWTNRQTDTTERPTHACSYTAGVDNDDAMVIVMMMMMMMFACVKK